MKFLYCFLSIVLIQFALVQSSYSQGWIRHFPEVAIGGPYNGEDVVQAPNGDFISCGYGAGLYFVRTTIDGDTIWTKTFSSFGSGPANSLQLLSDGSIVAISNSSSSSIIKLDASGNILFQNNWGWGAYKNAIRTTTDGGFVVVGRTSSFGTNGGSNELLIAKTDANGDTLWTQVFGDSLSDNGEDIRQTSDGGYIATGVVTSGVWGAYVYRMYVVKTDATGNLLWEKKLNVGTQQWHGYAIQQTLDGGYIVAGHKLDTAASLGNSRVMFAVKLDVNGNIEWTSDVLSSDLDCAALDVIQNADSSYVLTGYIGSFTGGIPLYQIPVVKIDKNGSVLWQKFFLEDDYTIPRIKGEAIKATLDGGYIITGTSFLATPYWERLVLIKLDAAGNAITTAVEGNVFADFNDDCNLDTLESPLQNWVVVATDPAGQTYYANTDSAGNYHIDAEYGTYQVTLAVPNLYWDTLCVAMQTVTLATAMQVDTVDFPVSALVPCPLLMVDISAYMLRLCFPSYYYVQYCNWGMADAPNAYVEVELDTFMTYLNSGVPATYLGGNLYRFDLGNVAAGACGAFYLNVTIPCDTNLAGITHCTEAHIYPDSICLNAWNGPNINLQVECQGDTVLFRVNNSGTNMLTALNYSIFEDNVMMRMGTYNLGNGQTEDVYVPALNGKTYRIEARQDPNFPPMLGDTIVALAIEACNVDSLGNFSTGFVTQFCNYDGSPFVDIDCQPNIGSFDPNDKLAYPVGYGMEHYIYAHNDLEYYVRFQNTGTDTAFRIVVIDTISPYLNIASLRVGASSHNYNYEIYGNGIIKFTFDNIMLPDSNINEMASHGFIKYSIEQTPNNPVGTIINNNADIYFDYNSPIRTNTTFHEIGENFVTIQLVGIEDVLLPNVSINVYPNPFHDRATVEIDGTDFMEINFEMYDMTGKSIYQKTTNDNKFDIYQSNLPQGMYVYRIIADGKLLNTGKLMLR